MIGLNASDCPALPAVLKAEEMGRRHLRSIEQSQPITSPKRVVIKTPHHCKLLNLQSQSIAIFFLKIAMWDFTPWAPAEIVSKQAVSAGFQGGQPLARLETASIFLHCELLALPHSIIMECRLVLLIEILLVELLGT